MPGVEEDLENYRFNVITESSPEDFHNTTKFGRPIRGR